MSIRGPVVAPEWQSIMQFEIYRKVDFERRVFTHTISVLETDIGSKKIRRLQWAERIDNEIITEVSFSPDEVRQIAKHFREHRAFGRAPSIMLQRDNKSIFLVSSIRGLTITIEQDLQATTINTVAIGQASNMPKLFTSLDHVMTWSDVENKILSCVCAIMVYEKHIENTTLVFREMTCDNLQQIMSTDRSLVPAMVRNINRLADIGMVHRVSDGNLREIIDLCFDFEHTAYYVNLLRGMPSVQGYVGEIKYLLWQIDRREKWKEARLARERVLGQRIVQPR